MNNKLFDISKNLLMQDIDTIYTIITQPDSESRSIFFMGVFSYFTACIAGAVDFLEERQISCNDLSIHNEFAPVLEKVRAKLKLYRERTGKNMSTIDSIRDNQNEKFAAQLRFPILKKFGINYDLGTYILDNQYIGNTFLYKWFFDEVGEIKLENPYFEYSKALGQAVRFIKEIWYINYPVCGNFNFETIATKDFNVTRRPSKLFGNNSDKGQCLFLFNIMCQVNFAMYYLKQVLDNENSLSIRIKYLIYYFSCSSLQSLKNYCEQNKTKIYALNYLDTENIRNLLNEEFCNCMRHYEIRDNNLNGISIDPNKEFDAMISFYYACSKANFIYKLNSSLEIISENIKKSILR